MSGILDHITPSESTRAVAVTMGLALAIGGFMLGVSLPDGTGARGLLWAAAWSSLGWVLGFVFGIPRFLSTDTARKPDAASALADALKAVENANADLETAATGGQKAKDMLDQAKQTQTDSQAALKTNLDTLDAAEKALSADPSNPALIDAKNSAAEAVALAKTKADEAAAAVDAASTDVTTKDKAMDAAKRAAERADTEVSRLRRDAATTGPSLTVNTNLEQISDWLTKIIVGVSLVEAQTLSEHVRTAASYMALSFAKAPVEVAQPALVSVSYAAIVYFLATGLLGSYLLTRLFLQPALNSVAQADPNA